MPNSFLGSGLLGVDIRGKRGRAVVAGQPLPGGAIPTVFGDDVLVRSRVDARPADLRRRVLQVDDDEQVREAS